MGKATQFRKGLPSANPGGRPKRNPFTTALIAMADQPLPDGFRKELGVFAKILPEKATVAEGVAASLLGKAICKSDTTAAALIIERVEGRMPMPKPVSEQSDLAMSMRNMSDEQLQAIIDDFYESLEKAQAAEEAAAGAGPEAAGDAG